MFKKVYSLYSAFCTQPAFYSQSAVCILHSVCILPPVRSLQSAVRSLPFTLTGFKTPGSKLSTNWIHAHKRTDLPMLAYIMMCKD